MTRTEFRLGRRGRSTGDLVRIAAPLLIGVLWALVAVDLSFVLNIDWAPPHGAVETVSYVLQVALFWPSALFTLAARASALMGWQPGWFGLTLLAMACGGGPGLLVGLVLFSWSRR